MPITLRPPHERGDWDCDFCQHKTQVVLQGEYGCNCCCNQLNLCADHRQQLEKMLQEFKPTARLQVVKSD